MKRKISLLIALMLILSTLTNVSATEETMDVTEEAEEIIVLELSIDEAVKMAIESNKEMWEIDYNIGLLQDAKRAGSSRKEYYEGADFIDSAENDYVDIILVKNNFYSKNAELKTKELQKGKEQLLKGIEIDVVSTYYKVLVAEKTIEINQTKHNKAKEQLRVVNLKYNNGSATKAEVLSAEMAVQQAKTDLDSAVDDLNIAKLDLLNKIDLPFAQEIVLADKELTYIPTAELNLDKSIETAKAERLEILTADNNLELQKIETHAYKAYYTSNLWQNKVYTKKLEDAELNVPQAYKDVELDVRKSYLNLVKAERSLVNMDKTVELAREAARINKLLYDNGMATSLDVLEADTNLAQTEIGHYQLLAAYNINKLIFDNSNILGKMPENSGSSTEETPK
ncbi:MAG: TolC family protein [Clostridiales bacterium]|nr:TolC family protein [Clostridiales bacterium]